MASKISNRRLLLVMSAEPQPRLQTRSIGQAEFRSCKKNGADYLIVFQNKLFRACAAYHEVGLNFVLQNLFDTERGKKEGGKSGGLMLRQSVKYPMPFLLPKVAKTEETTSLQYAYPCGETHSVGVSASHLHTEAILAGMTLHQRPLRGLNNTQ